MTRSPLTRNAPPHSTLRIDAEHGPREIPVEIVAETPKHYRVRLLEAAVGIGAGNYHRRGEVIQVRKKSIVVSGGDRG